MWQLSISRLFVVRRCHNNDEPTVMSMLLAATDPIRWRCITITIIIIKLALAMMLIGANTESISKLFETLVLAAIRTLTHIHTGTMIINRLIHTLSVCVSTTSNRINSFCAIFPIHFISFYSVFASNNESSMRYTLPATKRNTKQRAACRLPPKRVNRCLRSHPLFKCQMWFTHTHSTWNNKVKIRVRFPADRVDCTLTAAKV